MTEQAETVEEETVEVDPEEEETIVTRKEFVDELDGAFAFYMKKDFSHMKEFCERHPEFGEYIEDDPQEVKVLKFAMGEIIKGFWKEWFGYGCNIWVPREKIWITMMKVIYEDGGMTKKEWEECLADCEEEPFDFPIVGPMDLLGDD